MTFGWRWKIWPPHLRTRRRKVRPHSPDPAVSSGHWYRPVIPRRRFRPGQAILPGSASDPPAYRFRPLVTEAEVETQPAWSPDGKAIAYAGSINGISQVFFRDLGSPASVQITKSPLACTYPFWSPDGARIYYHAAGNCGRWELPAARRRACWRAQLVQQFHPTENRWSSHGDSLAPSNCGSLQETALRLDLINSRRFRRATFRCPAVFTGWLEDSGDDHEVHGHSGW